MVVVVKEKIRREKTETSTANHLCEGKEWKIGSKDQKRVVHYFLSFFLFCPPSCLTTNPRALVRDSTIKT